MAVTNIVLTPDALNTALKTWVDATKQANSTYTASTKNIFGLVDKIGKIVNLPSQFVDRLPELEGEELPLGATIEEYVTQLFMNQTNVVNDKGQLANGDFGTRYDIPEVKKFYSYMLEPYRYAVSEDYNNLEVASLTAEGCAHATGKIVKDLNDSYTSWRYGAKRQIIANAIAKCEALGTSDMVTSIAVPTDTETGEAFILKIKELVEIAKDEHQGYNLSQTYQGAAPKLTLYVKQGIIPNLQVNTLAGAFNKDELGIEVVVKPLVNFGDNTDAFAFLCDTRGLKLHNHYRAIRVDEIGSDDFVTFTKHSKDTAFISAATFMHVLKKSA